MLNSNLLRQRRHAAEELNGLTRIIHNPLRQQGRFSLNRDSKAGVTLVLLNQPAVESNVLADAAGYESIAGCFLLL